MVFYTTILLTFLFASSVSASSFCLECVNEINVNYLVTANKLPPLDQCRTVISKVCVVNLIWNESANTTAIRIFSIKADSQPRLSDDTLTAYATLETVPSNGSLSAQSGFLYMCISEPNCNDRNSIQRLLHTLIIQNQLQQQLRSLVVDVSPFNPVTARCFNLNNRTGECPPTVLDLCERCYILVDRVNLPGQEICGSCPVPSYAPINKLTHSKVFSLTERQISNDVVEIDCQTNGCNSLSNVNRVLQFSRIIFDMNKYLSLK